MLEHQNYILTETPQHAIQYNTQVLLEITMHAYRIIRYIVIKLSLSC